MTLNSNFFTKGKKIEKLFDSSKTNKITVDLYRNSQSAVVTSLDRTKVKDFSITNSLDISSNWLDMDFIAPDEGETDIEFAFKNWEIQTDGLKFNELSALRTSYLVKFGSGDILLDEEIRNSTTFFTTDYILSDNLQSSATNILTFYYGIYMTNVPLTEMEKGIKVKLQAELYNPSFFH